MVLFTWGCSVPKSFVSQDCGIIDHLQVNGVVRGDNSTPIIGATISLQSAGIIGCPNSEPSETIYLVTNEEGIFHGEIELVSEDDIIILVATANGYDTYYLAGRYQIFLDLIEIELERP
jgi:hypothetical protein